jgi:Fe-S-cluster-containing hydrogenase component 2
MVPLPESLENRFPEYLAVSLSRCIGCQECQQIFVPSGHFLMLERAKYRKGLRQANTVHGPFSQELAKS